MSRIVVKVLIFMYCFFSICFCQNGNPSQKFYNKAQKLLEECNGDAGLIAAQKSLQSLTETNSNWEICQTSYLIGLIYLWMGKNEEARQIFGQIENELTCFTTIQECKDNELYPLEAFEKERFYIDFYANFVQVNHNLGNISEAQKYLDKLCELEPVYKDNVVKKNGQMHIYLGKHYWHLGNVENAEENYKKALESDDLYIKKEATLAIAKYFVNKGYYEEAKEKLNDIIHFDKSKKLSRAERKLIGEAYYYLGVTSSNQSEKKIQQEALKYYENAIKFSCIDREVQIWAELYIGSYYLKQKKNSQALSQLKKVERLSTDSGSRRARAKFLVREGDIYYQLASNHSEKYFQYLEKSLSSFEKSLALSKLINYDENVIANYNSLGVVLSDLEKFTKAKEQFKKCEGEFEYQLSCKQNRADMVKYIDDWSICYPRTIQNYLRMQDNENVFNTIIKSKAQVFFEDFRYLEIFNAELVQDPNLQDLRQEIQKITKDITEIHLAENQDLQNIRNKIYSFGRSLHAESTDYSEPVNGPSINWLLKKREELKDEYVKKLFEKERILSQSNSFYKNSTPTLKEIKERIDENTAICDYYIMKNQKSVIISLITKKDFQLFEVELPDNFKDEISRYREILFHNYNNHNNTQREKIRLEKDLNRLSQKIYSYLITPIERGLKKKIGIIPHNFLHNIPYETLSDKDGQYLIEKNAVFYLPNISFLKKRTRQQSSSPKFLLIGDPSKDLIYTKESVNNIAKILEKYPKNVLLQSEVKKNEVKKYLYENGITHFHFSGHGEFNSSFSEPSFLKLANDKISDEEILSKKNTLELVVLNACESGKNKIDKGDNQLGMARSFFYSGSKNVIAGLWNLNDSKELLDFMGSFYKYLEEDDPVFALQNVKIDCIKSNRMSGWYSFILISDG